MEEPFYLTEWIRARSLPGMRARKKHPLPLVGAARLCFSRVWRVERRRLRRACRWRCCRPHLEGTCGPDRVVPETPPYALGRGSRFANDTAAGWSTAVSSARNTIETIFCLRRNHISFPLLNTSSQRVTNRQRVAEKEQTNEKMRPMSRKTWIRCPLP